MQEEYCPQEIEFHVQRYWEENNTFQAIKKEKKKNTTVFQCYLIPLVVYIWDTYGIIQ